MPNHKPTNWGKDKLSEFLEIAEANQLATFDNKKPAYYKLSEVDDCFQTTIDHLINCQPFVSVFLFLRAHAAYRGACRIAMAGQFVETFPLCRIVIENSLYAFHIYKNNESEEIWIKREDDERTLKAAKNEFTYGNVLKTLKSKDTKLAEIANELYKRSISYGGHPNEPGVTNSLQVFKNDKTVELKQLYLHADSVQLDLMLKSVAQCGLFPLKIAQKMWNFRVKFSGVYTRIDKLEKANL